jgi:fatty-acyl-CoA synthase
VASFTFSQLTPTAFLGRSARVFPDRTAVIDGDRRFSYRELADRSRRLAGALPGDRVAALCNNSSAGQMKRATGVAEGLGEQFLVHE